MILAGAREKERYMVWSVIWSVVRSAVRSAVRSVVRSVIRSVIRSLSPDSFASLREFCLGSPRSAWLRRGLPGMSVTAVLLGASGCDRAPSYSILGSFFPVWIFCFVAGLLLTALVHLMLRRWKLEGQLTPVVLVYPSLTALFTMGLWLIFYS